MHILRKSTRFISTAVYRFIYNPGICSYLPRSELNFSALTSSFWKFSMFSTWVIWLTSGGNWQLRGIKSMRPVPLRNRSTLKWGHSQIHHRVNQNKWSWHNICNTLRNTKRQAVLMNCITGIWHSCRLCFHGEDSADFTGSKQSDDIQCQKPLEQLTGKWYKVDAQSRPLRQQKQFNFVVTRIPQR